MGGVRIGGQAVVGCSPETGFAFVSEGSVDDVAVWLAHHDAANFEILNSGISGSGGNTPAIGDPCVSPDNCLVAYTTIPVTGTVNFLTVVRSDDSAAPSDYDSSPNQAAADGLDASMEPSWSPNGQYIVYVSTVNNNAGNTWRVARVDYDGGNQVDLLTGTNPAGPAFAGYTRPMTPQYSDDGTKILFWRNARLAPFATPERVVSVMDADGTNVIDVATGLPQWDTSTMEQSPCWLAGTTTVVYTTTSTGLPTSGDLEVRSVEADGTNDTLLYTDPEPLGTIDQAGTTKFASLPDGSAIWYAQWFPGDTPGEQFRVGTVDAGGGGWTQIAPLRRTSGTTYKTRFPITRQGRAWWTDGYLDGVVSIEPDGSDYTVEDNNQTIRAWFFSWPP